MTREEWIAKAKRILTARQYRNEVPTTEQQESLQQWAESLADDDGGCSYFEGGYTPEAAVDSELSYA